MKRMLKGITWDHSRGYDPLAAGATAFSALHPDIEVHWSRRSLTAFGEQPIEVLARQFDVLVVDHPFCGTAVATGCLIDLAGLMPDTMLRELAKDAVGPSCESYCYSGSVLALPTDAAAQVSAYRPDLLSGLGASLPAQFSETMDLAVAARANGKWIGVPLGYVDAACCCLSLLAGLGCRLDELGTVALDRIALGEALNALAYLAAASHPSSLQSNPIQMLDRMAAEDDIVYVPYVFGYSNYSRRESGGRVRFGNVAGPGSDPEAGSLLGGAGCAISSSCNDLDAARLYLEFVHAAGHQRGLYFDAGGQPGRRSAWTDERVNAQSFNYFLDTLPTLTKSYRRPRHQGFVPFMSVIGSAINIWLQDSGSSAALLDTIVRAYESSFKRRTVLA